MQGETTKQEADARGPDRVEALKARVDALAKLTQDLDDARCSAKRTRFGIVVGILLVFLIFGLSFYKMYKDFDKEDFVTQVQVSLMKPDAQTLDLFQTTVKEVVPVYMTEAQKQFGEVWPEMQKQLKAEGQKFLDNIADKVEEHVKAKVDALALKQQEKLLAEFPALKDEKTRDIVMENLQKALQGAVVDVLDERVTKAEARIWDVYDEMVKFLPKDSQGDFQARIAKAWDQFLMVKTVTPEMMKE